MGGGRALMLTPSTASSAASSVTVPSLESLDTSAAAEPLALPEAPQLVRVRSRWKRYLTEMTAADGEGAKELRPELALQRHIVPFHIEEPPHPLPIHRAASSAGEQQEGERSEAEWQRAMKRRAMSQLTSNAKRRTPRQKRRAEQSLIVDFFPTA